MVQEARFNLAGGWVSRPWSQVRRITKTMAVGLGLVDITFSILPYRKD